jgi:hypothetical protein
MKKLIRRVFWICLLALALLATGIPLIPRLNLYGFADRINTFYGPPVPQSSVATSHITWDFYYAPEMPEER